MTGWTHKVKLSDLPANTRRRIEESNSISAGEIVDPGRSQGAKRHKYGARKVRVDGILFDSKLEADYYEHLKMLRDRTGDVKFFLRQVPFHLPGGTILRIDFEVHFSDGTVSYQETKGYQTKSFKIKLREVEHHYPVKIEIITKDWRRLAA